MAGAVHSTNNTNFYLRNGEKYWLNSPYRYNYGGSYNYFINGGSMQFDYQYVSTAIAVRPTITINKDILYAEGNGSLTDPYLIPGNYNNNSGL